MKKLHVSLTDLVESDFFDREASGTIAEDEEVKEEPKEAPAEPEAPAAPAEPEEAPAEPEAPKEIEEVVGDWQASIAEAFTEVKSFKPGRKEALTFADLAQKLSDIANQAAADITKYYQDKLGNPAEEKTEEE